MYPKRRRKTPGAPDLVVPIPAPRQEGTDPDGHEEPIDAVYLWVSDQGPEFQQTLQSARRMAAHGDQDDATACRRFRDHGELRYSLRSLERHARWIRHVFVVTNGQLPEWLETRNPRLRCVRHDEIFTDPDSLPTFNSHAIELQLHRIPGLSRRFLYFNDDLFLGRDISRDDYINGPDAQKFYFQTTNLPRDENSGPVHDRAYGFTQSLLDSHLKRPAPVRHLPAHAPQLYNREVLASLEQRYPDAIRQTTGRRFRTARDFVLRIGYAIDYMENTSIRNNESVLLDYFSAAYAFIRMQQEAGNTLHAFQQLLKLRPTMFCINDDLEDTEDDYKLVVAMRQTLTVLFPVPSSFERNAPSFETAMQREVWNQRLGENAGLHGVGCVQYAPAVSQWMYRIRGQLFGRILKELPADPAASSVLDVGSGSGYYLRRWQKWGAGEIFGSDISDVAVTRLRAEFPGIPVVRSDVSALDQTLGERKFDLISCFDVLFHIVNDRDYCAALKAMGHLLRDDGFLLISENMLRASPRASGTYWRSRDRRFIIRALAEAGFEIRQEWPQFILFGSPVDTQSEWPSRIWDRCQRLISKLGLSHPLGALLYPLESLLIRIVRPGPSTKVMLCQKRTL